MHFISVSFSLIRSFHWSNLPSPCGPPDYQMLHYTVTKCKSCNVHSIQTCFIPCFKLYSQCVSIIRKHTWCSVHLHLWPHMPLKVKCMALFIPCILIPTFFQEFFSSIIFSTAPPPKNPLAHHPLLHPPLPPCLLNSNPLQNQLQTVFLFLFCQLASPTPSWRWILPHLQ